MIREEFKIQMEKAAPAIGGGALYGITLSEAVGVATLLYIAMQAAYLAWRWGREAGKW